MAILGNIIKTAIELKDKLTPETKAIPAQERVLIDLLETAKNTEFGRNYQFQRILDAPAPRKTFAETVPLHDYHQLYDQWWHRVVGGEKNITWPGKPQYFALSSGTTGSSSKRIPVTDEMLAAIRNTGIQQVTSLANFDLPPEFFEKEIMMLGSSTDLQQRGNFLEGEISGISASNIPFWFKGYYKPGDEIAKIDDWDERVQRIAEKAPEWDIGALSGIPSWIELMLKKVIEYHQLKNIHEIWPSLSVYTPGGVAFEPYRKSFEKLLAHPLIYLDTYLASEGFLAFQGRPDTTAMNLVVDNGIYFEFVPFEEKNMTEEGNIHPDAEILTLAEVEEERDYVLLISTVAGAWRYMIGDTIKFTDKARHEIIITGRTKALLECSRFATIGAQDERRDPGAGGAVSGGYSRIYRSRRAPRRRPGIHSQVVPGFGRPNGRHRNCPGPGRNFAGRKQKLPGSPQQSVERRKSRNCSVGNILPVERTKQEERAVK